MLLVIFVLNFVGGGVVNEMQQRFFEYLAGIQEVFSLSVRHKENDRKYIGGDLICYYLVRSNLRMLFR